MKLLEKLNEVILNAMQKDPSAWLYEVQAIMKETDGQVLPDNVYFIKVVFGLPNNHTMIYEVDKVGTMRTQIVDSPWLEDRPLPNKMTVDLPEAYNMMLQANLVFDSVDPAIVLRFPLYPGVNEPAYVFTVSAKEERKFISVSLYSAKVEFVK